VTIIVILNVVFSAFVVIGILALLGAGIISDKAAATGYSRRRRTVTPVRARREAKRGVRTALDA
jgi:hypothetical protein